MKKILLLIALSFNIYNLSAQTSCTELINYVKSKSYGKSYYSYSSSAISEVTFYKITDSDYNDHYFAIVKFTSSYNEYIYQVSSNTEFNYSLHYIESAGKAFWKYIQPYNKNLNCGANIN